MRSVANQYLGVSRLTPDLANTTGVCASLPQSEAPALFKHLGRYYLLASHLTGWWAAGPSRGARTAALQALAAGRPSSRGPGPEQAQDRCMQRGEPACRRPRPARRSPNPLRLFTTDGDSPCAGPWYELPPPARGAGADTGFNSQPAFVFTFVGQGGRALQVYYGDRWNYDGPGSVGNASYVWLPLLPPAEAAAAPCAAGLGARGREGGAAGGPLEQARCRQPAAGEAAGSALGPAAGLGPPVHWQLRWMDEWAIGDFFAGGLLVGDLS